MSRFLKRMMNRAVAGAYSSWAAEIMGQRDIGAKLANNLILRLRLTRTRTLRLTRTLTLTLTLTLTRALTLTTGAKLRNAVNNTKSEASSAAVQAAHAHVAVRTAGFKWHLAYGTCSVRLRLRHPSGPPRLACSTRSAVQPTQQPGTPSSRGTVQPALEHRAPSRWVKVSTPKPTGAGAACRGERGSSRQGNQQGGRRRQLGAALGVAQGERVST